MEQVKDVIESLVKEHGEKWHLLIADSVKWVTPKLKEWGIRESFSIDVFVSSLISDAKGLPMEAKGKVNKYICKNCGEHHLTINLNTGTTPFVSKCPHCNDYTAFSQMYSFNILGELTIDWCWYRPTKENLRTMGYEIIHHVLYGGLIKGELGEVVPILDQVDAEWEFEKFAEWCKIAYNVDTQKEDCRSHADLFNQLVKGT